MSPTPRPVPCAASRRALLGLAVAALVGGAGPQAFAANDGVAGRWRTIDDETGKPKAIVELTEAGGTLSGRIVELLDPPVPNPTCDACKGDRKGKPVRGLTIVWGLRQDEPGAWSGGQILDPKSGKEYRCKLELEGGGARLKVRGYMGVSLLGRTQVWQRER